MKDICYNCDFSNVTGKKQNIYEFFHRQKDHRCCVACKFACTVEYKRVIDMFIVLGNGGMLLKTYERERQRAYRETTPGSVSL